MSDDPEQAAFWRETPAGEPVADPPDVTPDDPPASITIGDHEFVWTKGVRAKVTLSDADGRELGTACIPYDPDNQPSEDEVFSQADRLYHDLEHLRSIMRDDRVRDVANELAQGGTADLVIKTVADVMRGGIKVVVTPGPDDPASTVEQAHAIATEAQRLIDDNLEQILADIASVEADGRTFWQDFARDILAHATLWARRDVEATIESSGHSPDDVADDEFERLIWEMYRDGPYVHQALLTLWQGWAELLAEILVATFSGEGEPPEGETPILDTLVRKARANLGIADSPASSGPVSPPVFSANGYARIPNDPISMGTRKVLVANWPGERTRHPEFSFSNGAGTVVYSPSIKVFPSVDDAWDIVNRLGDGHADLFDYIMCKMLVAKAARSRDVYGDFRLEPAEVLDARDIAKHAKGGHKPENIADVIRQLDDLRSLEVRASVTGHTRAGAGRRGRKETVTLEHAIPLIIVSETLYRTTLSGERIPIAWNLRPGNWARELEQFTPQFAMMMQGILRLRARPDAHAKRIGRYLIGQYRIRANERSWKQPYRIRTLLEGAGIDIPERNGARFRGRIEAAFDVLSNPESMGGPACIAAWRYPVPIEETGRGWFERWLQSGIVIDPPAEIVNDRYAKIGDRSRRRRAPHKLAG